MDRPVGRCIGCFHDFAAGPCGGCGAIAGSEEGLTSDRGDWMQTYTGLAFYPLDPRAQDIDPRDIAHALSLVCRYGGHIDRFYSVAEHCVLMSHAVTPEHALWALLHDATEAYVGDMVRPLKRSMPAYRQAEDRLMVAICERFGLDPACPLEVKDADSRILVDERAVLMRTSPHAWTVDDLEPLGVRVVGVQPAEAESLYLDRLAQLTGTASSGEPPRQKIRTHADGPCGYCGPSADACPFHYCPTQETP